MSSLSHQSFQVQKVLWITLGLNILVAIAKVLYGFSTGSLSLVADGFHSFFDGTSNVVALIGIWVSSRPPDDSHHYGHKKFETFAAVGIAFLLFITCYNILRSSMGRFSEPITPQVTWISFSIIGVTIAVNYFVMCYEQEKGKALGNELLLADSEHTRSDIWASCSVLMSLIAVKLNYPILDPFAALFIAILIGRVGVKILMESSRVLSDSSILEPKEIQALVMQVDGVKECHKVRTRGSQFYIYVDLHIHVPPDMTTFKAHQVAHVVEEVIKGNFPNVVDIIVHVEPHVPFLEND